MRGTRRILPIATLLFLVMPGFARAGMTVYDLNDVARLRLEDISFFGFLLLLAALGIRFLWNYLAKDFPKLPRLSFGKALSLTALLSILMLLVLIMISGARELLTPSAWFRQGSHYRPSEAASLELRQQSLESLRAALMQYANTHQGQFPPHDYVPEIPGKLRQAPDSAETRYIYLGGQNLGQSNTLLVCEPRNFGNERLVLFSDGSIRRTKTPEIYRLMGVKESR